MMMITVYVTLLMFYDITVCAESFCFIFVYLNLVSRRPLFYLFVAHGEGR